ncbi:MAG TPA: T9SS type A sorting domain-containing protein [Caldithrix abyssi]|uniref:T9SS type A sorting domain-containing protein n=1 Tax=Caldithrix abyssi TaxID=187145 RepID=A0A7V4UFP7_CALAY|nr:T9SS type A sorting domain-containing protein [Caldithrix abyssi]
MLKRVLFAVFIFCGSTFAQETFKAGEIIVMFKNQGKNLALTVNEKGVKTNLQSVDRLNSKYQCTDMYRLVKSPISSIEGLYVLTFPKDKDMLKIREDYAKDDNIEYVELNYQLKIATTPNDYYFSQQWNHDNSHLQSESAWELHKGSSNVIIGINDTGIDWEHPDLKNNIWVNPGEDLDGDGVVGDFGLPTSGGDENGIDDDGNGYIDDLIGWDFYSNDNNPMHSSTDGTAHGTKVSGMASAVTNNSIGVAGVSWYCKLMPTRAGNHNYMYTSDAVSAIYYAADNGVKVINMSWGGNSLSTSLKNALDYAYDTKGVVLTAAAMNANSSSQWYPAAYNKVIAVAALNQDDTKKSNSNYGSWVDVSAPGINLWTTNWQYPNTHTYIQTGATSIASPQVAGLAGLVFSMDPSLSNSTVRSLIEDNTDYIDDVNPSYAGLLGSGRINSYKTLAAVAPPAVPQNFHIVSVPANNGPYEHPKLMWNANSEADLSGYKIERKINSSGSWITIHTASPGETEYLDLDITRERGMNDSKAYYRMRAYDTVDLYSAYTPTQSYSFSGDASFKPPAHYTKKDIPDEFALLQNYPNPFNPQTRIAVDLPKASHVVLKVYSISGEDIATLVNGQLEAGKYNFTFNAGHLPSGIYLYRLKAGNYEAVKRMLLVK